jgi:hypothetical protein
MRNAPCELQVDSAANVQPEKVEDIWNLRGILNTSSDQNTELFMRRKI